MTAYHIMDATTVGIIYDTLHIIQCAWRNIIYALCMTAYALYMTPCHIMCDTLHIIYNTLHIIHCA